MAFARAATSRQDRDSLALDEGGEERDDSPIALKTKLYCQLSLDILPTLLSPPHTDTCVCVLHVQPSHKCAYLFHTYPTNMQGICDPVKLSSTSAHSGSRHSAEPASNFWINQLAHVDQPAVRRARVERRDSLRLQGQHALDSQAALDSNNGKSSGFDQVGFGRVSIQALAGAPTPSGSMTSGPK